MSKRRVLGIADPADQPVQQSLISVHGGVAKLGRQHLGKLRKTRWGRACRGSGGFGWILDVFLVVKNDNLEETAYLFQQFIFTAGFRQKIVGPALKHRSEERR